MKIDLGCGDKPRDIEWIGIDLISFPGVDIVCDLGREALPFGDEAVDEARAYHFIEHLTAQERCFIFNELYRVLKVGAKMEMVCPYYTSGRAYGDPTHVWPPISDYFFLYLNRDFRDRLAPHTDKKNLAWGYDCNFNAEWAFLHDHAGDIGDIQATLTKI